MKKFIQRMFLIIVIFTSSIFSQKGSHQDILPIELLYFEGFAITNGVLLRWGTATEVNNYGFEVQRADTSKNFEYLDFVPGSGNSNSPKHYFLVDSTLPSVGLYFYRLKQIDNDGAFHYSDTIQVYFNPTSVEKEKTNSQKLVTIRNNYLTNEIEIDFNSELYSQNFEVEIYSILGERVFHKSITSFSNQIKLNYSNFTSGVYIISIKASQKLYSITKFIVTH
jgi:hypothetical protein